MTHALRVFSLLQKYIAYDTGWAWQRRLAAEVRLGAAEAIALLEHAPVYTLGRRPHFENFLERPQDLQLAGCAVVQSDRGGDVTYHGPGQLVGYPILDLRARNLGPKTYVYALESVLIETLETFDVNGQRVPGRPGVWLGNDKLAAIGVRLQGGISTHGFALNVDPDLARFDAIVPCGLRDASVTSMQRLLGRAPDINEVASTLLEVFDRTFDTHTVSVSRELEQTPGKELVVAHGR